jgi:serine phosphatase RsbU (regulator of sigma subunit)
VDFLTVIAPSGERNRFEITSANVRIGRSSSCDLVLQDLNVSRLHAQLVRRAEGYYILDAGGKNGTYVNDRRIEDATPVAPGDRIRLGTTTLIFNGTPSVSVEFSDSPLEPGPGTTFLPADSVKTPGAGEVSMILSNPSTPGATLGPGASAFVSSPTGPGLAQGSINASALGVIFEADKELVFHRPLAELLETIMDLAGKVVRFERGLLMLIEGGQLRARVVRVPPEEVAQPISISRTITERVLSRRESILTSDALMDDRLRLGHSVQIQQIRSLMCAPLRRDREVIGLIYVDSRQRAGLFTQTDLHILTHLSNIAAVKLENARLFEQAVAAESMEQELQKAAELQNHLLPGVGPEIPGYMVYGSSISCRAVGGDYYDYITMPEGRIAVGLGDVAGKGLPAALLMTSFQASLRALSELDLPPGDTIKRLNRLLCRSLPDNRFVTFFYAVLDPGTRKLRVVNAGHNPPLVIRADGRRESLGQNGPPLGMFEGSAYTEADLELGAGEILICYSDGISEAESPKGEAFGVERLSAMVESHRALPPVEIVQHVNAELNDHCRGTSQQDDITLVVLKRTA